MSALDVAADFVMLQEGYSSTPYQDAKKVWTIGYGTTYINSDPVCSTTAACTKEQAVAWLETDLSAAYAAVIKGIKIAATDNEIAALTSFAYNVGIAAFLGSTLLAKFNDEDMPGCEAEFGKWVNITDPTTGELVPLDDLIKRRAAELALFLSSALVPVTEPVGTLRPDDVGPGVIALQTALKKMKFYLGNLDGDYGPMTRAAVIKYQTEAGINVDGIAGPVTLTGLGVTSTQPE